MKTSSVDKIPVKVDVNSTSRISKYAKSVSLDEGTMNLQSLGNLSGHPFAEAVRDTLDWKTYGYDSGVCWVNGDWADLSDSYAKWNERFINSWSSNDGTYSCEGSKTYDVFAMTYSFKGMGAFSFDYDVASFKDGDTGYDYLSGLVVIADNTVALMKDGKASGTFTHEFKTNGNHSITFIYNTYVETRYGSVIPDKHYAKIGNIKLDTDIVAKITKTDGSEVNYFSLQGAVNAVSEGETITLLTNVTENIVSSKNISYTLDLDKHSVDGNKNGIVYNISK